MSKKKDTQPALNDILKVQRELTAKVEGSRAAKVKRIIEEIDKELGEDGPTLPNKSLVLTDLTVDELKQLLIEKEVEFASNAKKDELVALATATELLK
ncbi:HeH/LEM domain-containing protein [Phocoenobacter skyensis]|uniref:HeH/LEM domain-containing protein n=1 Tax=Phocoenobacter skyensis TaxID=97481 RepID=A0ABT9JIW6_9PAST|nr:HeH/LEM domain-containing protein [Pasteurella skyensis]MDP8078341.1 HeH/LEM domain-containing protein [Pasteurella skyensis]MDP8084567.1 HeH/LEM domain-containing protein [Pasteurella skyensis]